MTNSIEKLDEVLPLFKSNKVVLFLGAGLSKIAGCLDWNAIIRKIIEHPIIARRIKLDEVLKDRINYDVILDYCFKELKDNNKENDYWAIVRKAFYYDPLKFRNDYMPLIGKIKCIIPFPILMTTNIDNCLEETGLLPLNQIYNDESQFQENNLSSGSIFHIHGHFENLKESLITRSQYIPRYGSLPFRDFMKKVFTNFCVIFMGYRLGEMDLRDLIREARHSQNGKCHYALFPTDEVKPSTKNIWHNQYGIKVIVYGPVNKFSEAISEWIDSHFNKADVSEVT